MSKHQPNDETKFIFTRDLNAPKELVFNAFSNAEALNEWWGPAESENSVISLDFKPGGIFHFKMDFEGKITYGRFLFGQIKPYDLLEFTNAFADEEANIVPAPFGIKLPREIFYRLVFTENNGKTTITLTGQPVNASKKEEDGFRSISDSMKQGFGGTFDQLVIYLNKIQKPENNRSNTADRELRISRLLNAPVDLVWEVWTDPDRIKNWWGPNGFTNTITKMEVKPGGEWDLVMHGPDGTDYKNKSIFREVIRHKKIVYEHVSGPKFLATIEFESRGDTTLINWHMLFESREQFIQVVKTFKADVGLKQNIEKLGNYLHQFKEEQPKY